MYSIYFNNRCLAVCSPDDIRLKDPEAVLFMPVDALQNNPSDPSGTAPKASTSLNARAADQANLASQSDTAIPDLPNLFFNSPNIHKLFIPSTNPAHIFGDLCSKMNRITAGGGLVTNSKGYILMIFRHGVWDLPKGKQEEYEECDQAALREVEEECGVHDLTIKNFICTTYHSYILDGELMLKHTNWYRMNYNGNGDHTTPQKEEDIEKAVWVKPEDLDYFLEKTYPSIRAVFARASIG